MRFIDSPNGERMKCLIYDILSKHGELRFLRIYAHLILSVSDDDYEITSQFNLQQTLNEMTNVGIIDRSVNFEYFIKPVTIEALPSATLDISDCFCDGNFGGSSYSGVEKV